ncbi:MAG: pilus assembly protein N-terminal domain-containing protein [Armatimonadota bacterium]|nr:pilus assembly protein N-terminal domain-containing protein [Armatimonadota bacterium]
MRLKYKVPIGRIYILVLLVSALVLPAAVAHSEPAPVPHVIRSASNGQSVDLIITTGTSYLLECQGLSKVAIGDPSVADIVPVSTAQLLINGKATGTTNMFVWDKTPAERLRSYKVIVMSLQPDLAAIAYRITSDIGSSGVVARPAGDCILLEGVVTDGRIAERAETIANAYCKNVKNMIQVTKTAAASAEVVQALQEALKGTNLTVRALPDGTVLIEGKVNTVADLDRVNTIIGNWAKDTKVVNLVSQLPLAARQVMIHAQILEINRNDLKDVGVDWGTLRNSITSSGTVTDITSSTPQDQPFVFGESSTGPFDIFDGGPIRRISPLSARINLLISNNKARVLSRPELLVADGNEANMLVGGEIPIPIVQSSSTSGAASVSVQWKEFGVRLGILPLIGDQNTILLKVAPEVSNLDFANAVRFSGFVIPALITRKAQSTVQVQNGQSLLIGGLYNSEDRKNVSRIPLLSKIPIIGEFFKTTSTDKIRTELVILITPEIVEPGTQPSSQSRVSALEQKQVLSR